MRVELYRNCGQLYNTEQKVSVFVYMEENGSSRSLGKEESIGIQTYRVKV